MQSTSGSVTASMLCGGDCTRPLIAFRLLVVLVTL
jgi:hypothetical protein